MRGGRSGSGTASARALEPGLQTIHIDVDDGRGEKRKELTENEAADDGDAQRTAKLGTNAGAERQGHSAEERRHGGLQNGPKTQQGGFVYSCDGCVPVYI